MTKTKILPALAAVLLAGTIATAQAADAPPVADQIHGNKDAPITVIEYASLTCTHCASFYNDVMPEIEKRYIETGKVKFIFRDYPLDGNALKASTITRCMPAEQYYPFVGILFKNVSTWAHSSKAEETLLQYAAMAGLPTEKAKACLNDTKLMDSIVDGRTKAQEKYDINSTPTFLINEGEDKIVGSGTIEEFAKKFDAILAKKKK